MGDRLPAHSAIVYTRGAIVAGTQNNTNEVTVHAGHDIQVGHKFFYALSRSNIVKTRVFTCTARTATTVEYSGATYTWKDGTFLVPLGNDTGGVEQQDGSFTDVNFDGSTVEVYSDPAGDEQYLNAEVPIEPGGDLGFWCNTADLWILARDSRGRIVRFYIVSQAAASGGGGGGIVVDEDTGTPGDDNNPSILVVREAGVGDIVYFWLKDSEDAYEWREILAIP